MARPRKFNDAQVVRAARDMFWTAGYSATSMDDLSSATGLSRGSLYGAFGDKRGLYLRALDEYCTEAVEAWRSELSGSESAYERLAQFVHAMATGIAGDVERRGCMLAKGAAELSGSDPAVAERASLAFEELHAALAESVAAAQAEGSLDPKADASKLASLLLAVLRGAEALGKGGVSPSTVTDAADQALALLPRGDSAL